MSGHTPGPWELWRGHRYVGGGEDICIGAGETWLVNMDHRASRCPGVYDMAAEAAEDWDHKNCPICTIDDPEITEEQLANARLIAAAPDLLEALEWLLENDDVEIYASAIERSGVRFDFYDWEGLARAAIAKAKGEA